MHIRINDFSGTLPKLHPTKLPDHAAQHCINAWVDKNVISPSKRATVIAEPNDLNNPRFLSAVYFTHNDIKYKKLNDKITNLAFSPVHDAYRLYWTTEDGSKPLTFSDWDIDESGHLTSDGVEYIAGMPPPDAEKLIVTGVIVKDPDPAAPTPPPPTTTTTAPTTIPEGSWITRAIRNVLNKAIEESKASAEPKTEDNLSDAIAEAVKEAEKLKTQEARVYALTYVNKFGDESAPGVKSEVLYINAGDQPKFSIDYAGVDTNAMKTQYGITAIRVYRSVTNSAGNAQFLFVQEVPFIPALSKIDFTDSLPFGSLLVNEPLPTINYDPPRADMRGLGVTDYGVAYGYSDKTICFSEPYLLYAWPKYYELSTQHEVMSIGHYDSAIVVATKGGVVLVNGYSPESMSVMTLPINEGCVSSRSMVNLNHGCMYASENGLVMVSTNSAKLLTEGVLSTEYWQSINPSSIHACAYKGGYLFFWDNGTTKGSGYIDLNDGSQGVLWFDDYALNTFIDNGVVQMIVGKPDIFGVVKSVYQPFNPEYGQAYSNKTYTWRSKTFNIDVAKRLLAAQVVADEYPVGGITFRVYADEVLLYETQVSSSKPFRIKNHSAKNNFSMEVISRVPIRELALGETMRDMIA